MSCKINSRDLQLPLFNEVNNPVKFKKNGYEYD